MSRCLSSLASVSHVYLGTKTSNTRTAPLLSDTVNHLQSPLRRGADGRTINTTNIGSKPRLHTASASTTDGDDTGDSGDTESANGAVGDTPRKPGGDESTPQGAAPDQQGSLDAAFDAEHLNDTGVLYGPDLSGLDPIEREFRAEVTCARNIRAAQQTLKMTMQGLRVAQDIYPPANPDITTVLSSLRAAMRTLKQLSDGLPGVWCENKVAVEDIPVQLRASESS